MSVSVVSTSQLASCFPAINAACVPRSGVDGLGRSLLHLSWAEFQGSRLSQLSHRWYTPDAELIHQEQLPMDVPLTC